MVPDDGRFCMIKDCGELVRFIGNLNGDYHCNLGVIEDSFGYIKIVRMSELEFISNEEAKNLDPIMYEILMEMDTEQDG